MSSEKDDPLAELLDRVRHRGLPPVRREVCSVCRDEAERIRITAKNRNIRLEVTREV